MREEAKIKKQLKKLEKKYETAGPIAQKRLLKQRMKLIARLEYLKM